MPAQEAEQVNSSSSQEEHHHHPSIGITVFVCLAASVIVFASAADECDTGNICDNSRYAWAIACGVVSVVICMIRLLFIYLKAHIDPKLDAVIGAALLILWGFGAAFNTSVRGPFVQTRNGYFGTWVAFGAASVLCAKSFSAAFETLRSRITSVNTGVLLVAISSFIVMAVAADVCDNTPGPCTRRRGFAVASGSIGLLVSIAEMITKVTAIFLVGWWAVGAAVNTSAEGPFSSSCDPARGAANGL
eukprot:gene10405-2536_t